MKVMIKKKNKTNQNKQQQQKNAAVTPTIHHNDPPQAFEDFLILMSVFVIHSFVRENDEYLA